MAFRVMYQESEAGSEPEELAVPFDYLWEAQHKVALISKLFGISDAWVESDLLGDWRRVNIGS